MIHIKHTFKTKQLPREEFVRLVLSNDGNNIISESPDFSSLNDNDVIEKEYSYGNEITIQIRGLQADDLWAIRVKKSDINSLDSDYIYDGKNNYIHVEYRQKRNSNDHNHMEPSFPRSLVIQGLVKDRGLIVSDNCHTFFRHNTDRLLKLLSSTTRFPLMPCVFISTTITGKTATDPTELAKSLSGLAHVLIADSHYVSRMISNALCPHITDGGIYIYFPYSAGKYISVPKKNARNTVSKEISDHILGYYNRCTTPVRLTWAGVQSAVNDRKYAACLDAHEGQRSESHQMLKLYEDENASLTSRIQYLERSVAAKEQELYGLRLKLDKLGSTPLLLCGRENDFFPGEIQDLILKTLSDSLGSLQDRSRRADIIRDILDANEYKELSKGIESQLKDLFTGYTSMSTSLRQGLKELGLEVSDAGKHYKVTYHGDPRYTSTVAKTASDYREGLNAAHNLIQTII